MKSLVSLVKLAPSIAYLLACQSKAEPTRPTGSASAPARSRVTAAATPSSPAVVTPPPAGLPEAEARSLVARWEAAQNAQDFEVYSAMYAERFMGVKRVGAYSKRFDRKGWLADRKPMFDAAAKVKVTGLELSPAPGATRAIFTQEFVSGTFRDTGKKELFLIATPGGIAISREEMLSSEVSAVGATAESVLAYHRDGAVVQRSFDKNKLRSAAQLLSVPGASPVDIAFDVTPEELGEGARAWLGREVTVYTTEGQTCTGRVARFQVRVQAVPHFGILQQWKGQQAAPRATPEEIAKTIQGMARSEEHFVVGVLDHACSGAWATGATQPFTAAIAAQGKLRDAALAALRALPAYAELQKRFVKEGGDPSRGWETVDAALNAVELRVPNRPAWLLVSAHGGAGCANFNGSLSALWQIGGTADAPQLTPASPTFNEFLSLRGALDQGPAGLALLTGPDAYDDQLAVVRVAPKPSRRVVHHTSFWDCDC